MISLSSEFNGIFHKMVIGLEIKMVRWTILRGKKGILGNRLAERCTLNWDTNCQCQIKSSCTIRPEPFPDLPRRLACYAPRNSISCHGNGVADVEKHNDLGM